jgi:hypothetical protein
VKATPASHINRKGNAMTIRMNKTFAAALTALTLLTSLATASTDAQAKGFGKGWGKGWHGKHMALGLGVLGAAAFAGSYVYACERIPVYDRFGNYLGSRRVCADD